MMQTNEKTSRLTQSPVRLMRQALGSPTKIVGKLARFGDMLRNYSKPEIIEKKLDRLILRGHIETAPTRIQLAIGAYDMLRFWISPAAADYYASKNISYAFHQVLRLLDEPASLTDPIGFFSTRDGIIGHVMQVVHANPVYDLQLLDLYEDGLDGLDQELAQMIAGTHPRSQSIGAIVEEPTYHRDLLAFLRAWRSDPMTPSLLRSNVSSKPEFVMLEKTFGSLTHSMAYFCQMPTTILSALNHSQKVTRFPMEAAQRAQANVAGWREGTATQRASVEHPS